MKFSKKIVLSSLFSLVLILSLGGSIYADSTANETTSIIPVTPSQEGVSVQAYSEYGPFYVRSENVGEYGGFTVVLNSGVTSFYLSDYKVYGVHAGEKAHIMWTFTDFNTGKVLLNKSIGDTTTPTDFLVSGLPSGATINVSWQNMDNTDVVGGTYVLVDGYAYD
ncbi:MAG: hypothetical protein E7L01_02375 [Paenibacillus macerans]|uniref:Uncharacterized protein n=1 Tax=Paenibacillus macerans TaxID=44252 RepID=A0A091A7F4_PAEMA|nr:hypothetical protein [Paenibacillus macerans]KFN12161.1 hypothetical protein DJ90_2000 [Paenibacillus macerans]MCY7558504.1 hypothetical protein [Paenibacillus macerans]MDU7472197.1 hypothetical protein [Paenibacillus macerans]MEC0150270.1 hypothetical protein [Paenibacillus macerans]MEC0332013.1 hypothetical protein [Paenibacillus macerans]